MNLLVDGHNLIGQIPSMRLSDPDDEWKLVLLLRRYAVRTRGRQVIVVFDRGVSGHPHNLNGYGVTAIFARSPEDADAELIRRINAIRRPQEWAVVTADRQVARAAATRNIRVYDARKFAAQIVPPRPQAPPPMPEKPNVPLSKAQIEEWMQIMGLDEEDQDDP